MADVPYHELVESVVDLLGRVKTLEEEVRQLKKARPKKPVGNPLSGMGAIFGGKKPWEEE